MFYLEKGPGALSYLLHLFYCMTIICNMVLVVTRVAVINTEAVGWC